MVQTITELLISVPLVRNNILVETLQASQFFLWRQVQNVLYYAPTAR